VPRSFIDCHRPAYPTIDAVRARVRAQAGWRIVARATRHCPQVTMPGELVQLLLDVCSADSGV
jgi:hypothetical protein